MSSSSSSPPKKESKRKKVEDGSVKRSISIRFVRHAESRNNEIYREARRIYRGGTPDFDLDGWNSYVDEHRLADPGLSARGRDQARALADGYLVEHLANQASRPVRFVVSPMRRTLDTVLPTLRGLEEKEVETTAKNADDERGQQHRGGGTKRCCEVIVNALFHESEGCHIREKPEPGMNQVEITDLLSQQASLSSEPTFVGFPAGDGDDDPRLRGWYANGTGSETRPESERRAAKFYLWMCEFLDAELRSPAPEPPDEGEQNQQQRRRRREIDLEERRDHDDHHPHHDVFDAGVTVPGEEHEVEHDWSAPRRRRRRTAIFVGHGDFMGLVLKRIVAGFGYAIEQEGISHRSAFVHFNTGITDLEYFGNGRFLVMSVNQTPHLNRLPPDEAHHLKTGGGLKDGWSYLVPNERHLLYEEVSVAFSDELEDHVREQTEALKDLYLRKGSGRGTGMAAVATAAATTTVPRTESGSVGGAPDMKSIFLSRRRSSFDTLASRRHTEESFTFEELSVDKSALGVSERVGYEVTFVVRRGMQVVGCASFQEDSGLLTDVVVRPSARRTKVGTALVDAVKTHLKKTGKSNNTILVRPTCQESRDFFEAVGFQPVEDDVYTSDSSAEPNFGIMTCKL